MLVEKFVIPLKMPLSLIITDIFKAWLTIIQNENLEPCKCPWDKRCKIKWTLKLVALQYLAKCITDPLCDVVYSNNKNIRNHTGTKQKTDKTGSHNYSNHAI